MDILKFTFLFLVMVVVLGNIADGSTTGPSREKQTESYDSDTVIFYCLFVILFILLCGVLYYLCYRRNRKDNRTVIITNGGRYRQRIPSRDFHPTNSRTRLIRNSKSINQNFGVGSQTVRPFASAGHLSHPTIIRNSAIMSYNQARILSRIRHDENVYAVPFECNNGTVKLRLVELNNKADVTIAPSCDQSLEGSEVEENFYHELDDIRSLVPSDSLMHLGDVQDDDEINSNENNSDARNDYGEEPIYAIITPKSMRQKKAPVQNDEVFYGNVEGDYVPIENVVGISKQNAEKNEETKGSIV